MVLEKLDDKPHRYRLSSVCNLREVPLTILMHPRLSSAATERSEASSAAAEGQQPAVHAVEQPPPQEEVPFIIDAPIDALLKMQQQQQQQQQQDSQTAASNDKTTTGPPSASELRRYRESLASDQSVVKQQQPSEQQQPSWFGATLQRVCCRGDAPLPLILEDDGDDWFDDYDERKKRKRSKKKKKKRSQEREGGNSREGGSSRTSSSHTVDQRRSSANESAGTQTSLGWEEAPAAVTNSEEHVNANKDEAAQKSLSINFIDTTGNDGILQRWSKGAASEEHAINKDESDQKSFDDTTTISNDTILQRWSNLLAFSSFATQADSNSTTNNSDSEPSSENAAGQSTSEIEVDTTDHTNNSVMQRWNMLRTKFTPTATSTTNDDSNTSSSNNNGRRAPTKRNHKLGSSWYAVIDNLQKLQMHDLQKLDDTSRHDELLEKNVSELDDNDDPILGIDNIHVNSHPALGGIGIDECDIDSSFADRELMETFVVHEARRTEMNQRMLDNLDDEWGGKSDVQKVGGNKRSSVVSFNDNVCIMLPKMKKVSISIEDDDGSDDEEEGSGRHTELAGKKGGATKKKNNTVRHLSWAEC